MSLDTGGFPLFPTLTPAQDDWETYTQLTGDNIAQIVGDDLLCTNPTRVAKAIDLKACTALLLKVRRMHVVACVGWGARGGVCGLGWGARCGVCGVGWGRVRVRG